MRKTPALIAILSSALVALLAAWWIAGTDATPAADTIAAAERASRAHAATTGVELEHPSSSTAPSTGASSLERVAVVAPEVRSEAVPRHTGTDVVGSVLRNGGPRRLVKGAVLHFSGPSGVETALATDGEYVVPALKPGRWHVNVRVEGYVPLATDVEVYEQPGTQRIDLFLDRLPHLKVKMYGPDGELITQAFKIPFDDDAPAEVMFLADAERNPPPRRAARAPRPKHDVLAIATAYPPGSRLAATLDDGYESYGHGVYRPFTPADSDEADIADKYSGILELKHPLPVYVSATLADAVLQTQFVPWDADEVVFHLTSADLDGNMGGLRFRIVDAETGRPLTHGRVGLHANGKYGMGADNIIDPNGYVVFDGEPPGPRHLSIVVSGHEWVVEQVHIDAGHITDLGTYRLNRPISITGEVVDERDQPVRAWVSVWPLERYEGTIRINEHFCWHSAEDGRFTISPAGRRKYVVRLNDDDWSGEPVVIDASQGSVQGIRLHAHTSSSVSVSFDPETPRGARLSVTDRNGLPIAERSVEVPHKALVRLAPGRYHMAVALGEESFGERNVSVDSLPLDVSFGP
jgi:hypothetical protein